MTAKEIFADKKVQLNTFSLLDKTHREHKKERDELIRAIAVIRAVKPANEAGKKIQQDSIAELERELSRLPPAKTIDNMKHCADIVAQRILLAKKHGHSKALLRKEIRAMITDTKGKQIPERTFLDKMKIWEEKYFDPVPGTNKLALKNGALTAILKEYRKK
jgi:hypothetical protein